MLPSSGYKTKHPCTLKQAALAKRRLELLKYSVNFTILKLTLSDYIYATQDFFSLLHLIIYCVYKTM